MQFRLRTLLILLAVVPPALAWAWWIDLMPIVGGLAALLLYGLLAVAIMRF